MYGIKFTFIVFVSALVYCFVNAFLLAPLLNFSLKMSRLKSFFRAGLLQSCIALLMVVGLTAIFIYFCDYTMEFLRWIGLKGDFSYCLLDRFKLFAHTTVTSLLFLFITAVLMQTMWLERSYKMIAGKALIITTVSNAISCAIKFISTYALILLLL